MAAIPPAPDSHSSTPTSGRASELTLARISIGLAVLGVVVSVLVAVAPVPVAMLVLGLLIGVPVGVLLRPIAYRGAVWLANYLER